jgi:hypothetical protein
VHLVVQHRFVMLLLLVVLQHVVQTQR